MIQLPNNTPAGKALAAALTAKCESGDVPCYDCLAEAIAEFRNGWCWSWFKPVRPAEDGERYMHATGFVRFVNGMPTHCIAE